MALSFLAFKRQNCTYGLVTATVQLRFGNKKKKILKVKVLVFSCASDGF